jgi:hypothetical protein
MGDWHIGRNLRIRKRDRRKERSEVERESITADIKSSEKIAETAFTHSSEHTS